MVYIMAITKIMMVLVVKKLYYGFSELDKSSRLRIGNFIMKVPAPTQVSPPNIRAMLGGLTSATRGR